MRWMVGTIAVVSMLLAGCTSGSTGDFEVRTDADLTSDRVLQFIVEDDNGIVFDDDVTVQDGLNTVVDFDAKGLVSVTVLGNGQEIVSGSGDAGCGVIHVEVTDSAVGISVC